MRAVYLIRHGRPDIPDGEKLCLGRKDLPLSYKGKEQAKALKGLLCLPKGACLISSPLTRSMETARYAGFFEISVAEGLTEIDTGEWDGLPFEEIKKIWPKEYEARGKDPVYVSFPKGESFFDCSMRTKTAFEEILRERNTGDLVLFTHKGVIQTLTGFLTDSDLETTLKMDVGYTQITAFLLDGNKAVCDPVILPKKQQDLIPDTLTCRKLFQKYKTPEKVQDHCVAVAEKAVELCERLENKGIILNRRLIFAAASLHDIARVHKNHARVGASWIFSEGYPSVAAIIGDHMQLPTEEEIISEKSVVFLADKYVKQSSSVSLQERYLKDKSKEQLEFAIQRYAQAKRIEKRIEED